MTKPKVFDVLDSGGELSGILVTFYPDTPRVTIERGGDCVQVNGDKIDGLWLLLRNIDQYLEDGVEWWVGSAGSVPAARTRAAMKNKAFDVLDGSGELSGILVTFYPDTPRVTIERGGDSIQVNIGEIYGLWLLLLNIRQRLRDGLDWWTG